MTDSSVGFAPAALPWALILAAGSGRRLAAATGGTAKQFLRWRGVPLFWHSARAMSRSAAIGGLVFVFPASRMDAARSLLDALHRRDDLGLPWFVAQGGPRRQDSVALGLAALPGTVRHVLVHDAARPFVSPGLVRRLSAALAEGAEAVIPVLPVTDTIKRVAHGFVRQTLPRAELAAVQTPQGFALPPLRQAHARARENGLEATDDAALMEAMGHEVRAIDGEACNVKITNPDDLALLRDTAPQPETRTGMGYDVHRYATGGRPLVLGGVPIPGGPEVLAHSDGDVLLHALMDALLGCACLGDIGQHFPDKDPAFAGISSAVLLRRVLDMTRAAGVQARHADLTVVAQTPRLAPHSGAIRKNVARLLDLPAACVNIKASTEEGLGFTGRAEGIKVYAVVSAQVCPQPPGTLDTGEA